jgi:hypothetical protein
MKVPWVDEPPKPGEAEEDSLIEMTERELKHLRKFQKSNGRFPTRDEILALLRRLRASKKFRTWSPETAPLGDKTITERHYSAQELAISWGVSAETIRILFRKEAGVLHIPSRQANGKKRSYESLRIPESIAQRVHRRLSAIPQ